MPSITDDTDVNSTFSDDGGLFSFSLTKLQTLVAEHLKTPCTLWKLAEGGNHKIYDIVIPNEDIVASVVRVACPDFPVDKLESEIATLRYIAASTSLPVPKVLAWNSDSANCAGAEYMILEKIKGVSASTVWKDLKMDAKETFVRDVARSLLELFKIRFQKAGSLYSTSDTSVRVGPLVTSPFFRALEGEIRFPDTDPLELSQFRGPFSQTSDFLLSAPKAELHGIKHQRDNVLRELDGDQARLDQGERVLQKVLRLAEIYPGNLPIGASLKSDGSRSFSLKLDDFRLSNIMIDQESGRLTGLIDFEATTTAPLWMCAVNPHWLDDIEDGDEAENLNLAHLREIFNDTIKQGGEAGEEWMAASERGRWFRDFAYMLEYRVNIWASEEMERWVDKRLAFPREFPGIGLPDQTLEEEIAERYGNKV